MAHNDASTIGLAGLLKERFILLGLAGNNKLKVIAELAELAAKSKKMASPKVFSNAILKRESLGSTGIGNGVAIPHAKLKAVKDFVLVFARHDKGIDFGALDGEKTYLFFALASPEEKVGTHLKILAEISHLVKDKFMVEQLRKAKEKKDILSIIASFKRR